MIATALSPRGRPLVEAHAAHCQGEGGCVSAPTSCCASGTRLLSTS